VRARTRGCGSGSSLTNTMHISVVLSVKEAELFAVTNNAQAMFYTHIIVDSLGLHVQLPMILEVDNKGAQLKEEGINNFI
jgi:hypothetical protein